MNIKTYNFSGKRVYVVGDIHGHFAILSNKVKELKITDSVIIFAGDIGLGFEKYEHYNQIFPKINKVMKERNVTLLFVRGNHDSFSYFENELINYSNIKSIPDYSVVNMHQDWDYDMKDSPKFSILCVGGGVSIDRLHRLNAEEASAMQYQYYHLNATKEEIDMHRKKLYWSNELPFFNIDKLDEITKKGYNIEYVVTHSSPDFCYPFNKNGIKYWFKIDENLEDDVNYERKVMTNIYNYLIKNKHILKGWAYGHFHSHYYEIHNNVSFTLLDCESNKWDMIEFGYKPMNISV